MLGMTKPTKTETFERLGTVLHRVAARLVAMQRNLEKSADPALVGSNEAGVGPPSGEIDRGGETLGTPPRAATAEGKIGRERSSTLEFEIVASVGAARLGRGPIAPLLQGSGPANFHGINALIAGCSIQPLRGSASRRDGNFFIASRIDV